MGVISASHEAQLLKTYGEHPLSAEAILERVLRQRGSLDGLTERDLAFDEETAMTDQNHVGGAAFVEQLAEAAGITASSSVADWCCGLGGPARYLAHRYGCRVDGVDLSPKRIEDARQLTSLVGLEGRLHFETADVLAMPLRQAAYDVVWGQGAWMHIADKHALFARTRLAVRPAGRVGFEDVYLARQPDTRSERMALGVLERAWLGRVITLPQWLGAVTGAGFRPILVQPVSGALADDCRWNLDALSSRTGDPAPEGELHGLRAGLHLAEAGVIGYVRVVASNSSVKRHRIC